MHNASFLRYLFRSKNDLFLLSAAQSIANFIDLVGLPCKSHVAFLWEYHDTGSHTWQYVDNL
jgi:hypothetical protein